MKFAVPLNATEMDTKIVIKEKDPVADAASQNERELFAKDAMKTDSDAVHLNNGCDMAIEREIKSESHFSGFCLQEEREFFHPVRQIKSAPVTCSDIYEIGVEANMELQTSVSNLVSHYKREFLSEDPVNKVQECNRDHEMNTKIEIKEEHLETEAVSVFDDIKDVCCSGEACIEDLEAPLPQEFQKKKMYGNFVLGAFLKCIRKHPSCCGSWRTVEAQLQACLRYIF